MIRNHSNVISYYYLIYFVNLKYTAKYTRCIIETHTLKKKMFVKKNVYVYK